MASVQMGQQPVIGFVGADSTCDNYLFNNPDYNRLCALLGKPTKERLHSFYASGKMYSNHPDLFQLWENSNLTSLSVYYMSAIKGENPNVLTGKIATVSDDKNIGPREVLVFHPAKADSLAPRGVSSTAGYSKRTVNPKVERIGKTIEFERDTLNAPGGYDFFIKQIAQLSNILSESVYMAIINAVLDVERQKLSLQAFNNYSSNKSPLTLIKEEIASTWSMNRSKINAFQVAVAIRRNYFTSLGNGAKLDVVLVPPGTLSVMPILAKPGTFGFDEGNVLSAIPKEGEKHVTSALGGLVYEMPTFSIPEGDNNALTKSKLIAEFGLLGLSNTKDLSQFSRTKDSVNITLDKACDVMVFDAESDKFKRLRFAEALSNCHYDKAVEETRKWILANTTELNPRYGRTFNEPNKPLGYRTAPMLVTIGKENKPVLATHFGMLDLNSMTTETSFLVARTVVNTLESRYTSTKANEILTKYTDLRKTMEEQPFSSDFWWRFAVENTGNIDSKYPKIPNKSYGTKTAMVPPTKPPGTPGAAEMASYLADLQKYVEEIHATNKTTIDSQYPNIALNWAGVVGISKLDPKTCGWPEDMVNTCKEMVSFWKYFTLKMGDIFPSSLAFGAHEFKDPKAAEYLFDLLLSSYAKIASVGTNAGAATKLNDTDNGGDTVVTNLLLTNEYPDDLGWVKPAKRSSRVIGSKDNSDIGSRLVVRKYPLGEGEDRMESSDDEDEDEDEPRTIGRRSVGQSSRNNRTYNRPSARYGDEDEGERARSSQKKNAEPDDYGSEGDDDYNSVDVSETMEQDVDAAAAEAGRGVSDRFRRVDTDTTNKRKASGKQGGRGKKQGRSDEERVGQRFSTASMKKIYKEVSDSLGDNWDGKIPYPITGDEKDSDYDKIRKRLAYTQFDKVHCKNLIFRWKFALVKETAEPITVLCELMFLLSPCDTEFALANMLDCGVLIPFCFYYVRPHIAFEMGSVITCATAGAMDLVFLQNDSTLGVNATNNVGVLSTRLNYATVMKHPEQFSTIRDCCVKGYLGGGGIDTIEFDKDFDESNRANNRYKLKNYLSGSVLYMISEYPESIGDVKSHVYINGEYIEDKPMGQGSGERGVLHSNFSIYSDMYGFPARDTLDYTSMQEVEVGALHLPRYMCMGAEVRYSAKNRKFNSYSDTQGPRSSGGSFPGAAETYHGRSAYFPDVDCKKMDYLMPDS